jgi:hypothetical protein
MEIVPRDTEKEAKSTNHSVTWPRRTECEMIISDERRREKARSGTNSVNFENVRIREEIPWIVPALNFQKSKKTLFVFTPFPAASK